MSRNSVNLDLASRFLSYPYGLCPARKRTAPRLVTLSSISYFKGSNTNVTLPQKILQQNIMAVRTGGHNDEMMIGSIMRLAAADTLSIKTPHAAPRYH